MVVALEYKNVYNKLYNIGGLNMKKAFTLAEVLVTLGIIGVVSAMTVPTLMQNYQRQSYVTQLHKVYNEISQAVVSYQTERNAVNLTEAGLSSTAAVQNWLKTYMRTVSECDNTGVPCFAESYKTMAGVTVTESYMDFTPKSYVLPSGAAIRPLYSKDGNKLINVCIDINGQQGPNILGRDLFFMAIYNNGTIDTYVASSTDTPLSEEVRDKASVMWKPFAAISNDNWEMTY